MKSSADILTKGSHDAAYEPIAGPPAQSRVVDLFEPFLDLYLERTGLRSVATVHPAVSLSRGWVESPAESLS